MKKAFEKTLLKIDALTLRERIIMCLSIVFVFVGIFDQLVFSPLNKKIDGIKNETIQAINIRESNEAVLVQLEQKKIVNPNDELKSAIARAEQENQVLDTMLAKSKAGLVPPERMLPLLSEMLGKNSQLSLISMENKKPALIDNESGSGAKIYKHSIVLKFSGGFSQVKNYLAKLESTEEKIYFDEVKYQTKGYPKGELTLDVYTLSVYEALISG